jgi:hypothetical protein
MSTRIVVLLTLVALAAASALVPRAMRAHRLAEDEKLLRASPGALDPRVLERLIQLAHQKNWEEASLLSDRIGPAAEGSPEALLYGARADLELGKVDRAREKVRRAKVRFRRDPQERIRLETQDPELFWKIGYLLREPGA